MQGHVLGKDAWSQFSRNFDPSDLGTTEGQRLSRQDISHLAGPNPEGDRTKRAMRAGMAVATGNGHAGLGQSLLGPDNMDHSLPVVLQVEQPDAEVAAVLFDGRHHFFGQSIGKRSQLDIGGNNMVDGRQGPLGKHHRQVAIPQHRKCLRTGHFVNQMQPDEKLRLSGRERTNRVQIPNLVEQITPIGHVKIQVKKNASHRNAHCTNQGRPGESSGVDLKRTIPSLLS